MEALEQKHGATGTGRWEMGWSKGVVAALGVVWVCGCSTTGEVSPRQARERIRVAEPVVSVQPPPVVVEKPKPKPLDKPQPVYRNPTVAEVGFGPYVNERGELIEPGKKYVFVDPGGWNLDAVRNPERGYIPPENQVPVPGAPGRVYTPGGASPGAVREELPVQPRLLFDLSDIRVTGMIGRGDEARARELAGPGEVAVYDERMGWVIVPSEVLRGVYNLPSEGRTNRSPGGQNP